MCHINTAAVLFSMVTAGYAAPWFLSARGGLGRFPEDGLDDFKLWTGEGARGNTVLGAPAVAKQTKPI